MYSKACRLSKVLDIYLTIEACATIICNLHINKSWLYFKIFVAIYTTFIFSFSIYYYYYDEKLEYFMAFFTNWVLLIQWIYFLFSSFITYKIYKEIEPKFEKSNSSKVRHNVSQQWDLGIVLSNISHKQSSNNNNNNNNHIPNTILRSNASYEIVGKPPNLSNLGLKKLFLFTKLCLEISLPYSFGISCIYWLTLFSGYYIDIFQAIYYINSHGIIFLFQLFDCYGSTYQLRYIYGFIFILLFAIIAFGWQWIFEELNFINPFTNTNQLYVIFDWHNYPIQSLIIYLIAITIVTIIYFIIVFTKNLLLIRWKYKRQADNQQLSANDLIHYDDDDDTL